MEEFFSDIRFVHTNGIARYFRFKKIQTEWLKAKTEVTIDYYLLTIDCCLGMVMGIMNLILFTEALEEGMKGGFA